MKKNIFFFFSVFFSPSSFSVDLQLEGSASENSSALDFECPQLVDVSVDALVPQENTLENTMDELQFPKCIDGLSDLFASTFDNRIKRDINGKVLKKYRKVNDYSLRRFMFKKKYDLLVRKKCTELLCKKMYNTSLNENLNQENVMQDDQIDDQIMGDHNSEHDDMLPMDDVDYFRKLEEKFL